MQKVISSYITSTRFSLHQAVKKLFYVSLKKPIAVILVYSGLVLRLSGLKDTGLKLILKGRRVDQVERADVVIRQVIEQQNTGEKSELYELLGGLSQAYEGYDDRILILKLPITSDGVVVEKGALIFKFTEVFAPALLALDVRLLSKYFCVILEPSWAGYSIEEILAWTTLSPEKVVVLTPDDGDFQFLTAVGTNLVPIKLGAADWVNPANFNKIKNETKIYDAIYVANFNPIKRVDRYIRAIVRVARKKKNYHAALVCANHGEAREEVMATLEWASKKAKISFFDGMPQSDLNELVNQSKVNVLLSLKEGANKGLSEGLFSGTPALLLSENVGVNRASINEHTGKIVADADLEDSLLWFSEHHAEYQPENWANEHISPVASTKVLADKIKELEAAQGRGWSVGLFPKVNEPELAYLDDRDNWLLSKREELLARFLKGEDEKGIVDYLLRLQDTNA